MLAAARRTRSRPASPAPHDAHIVPAATGPGPGASTPRQSQAEPPLTNHIPLPSLSSIPIPDPSSSTFQLEDGVDRLEIILPTDTLILRSTGTHAEQTEFSGTVVLNLPNAMAIKSLTLTLTGKSKIPSPPGWDG